MPGRNLSNEERRLQQFWTEPPAGFDIPLLKGISIEGPPPLRGIERFRIAFDHPICGICGRNGAGKSTILSLAAFSCAKPDDWTVAPWPTAPTRRASKATAYNWSDFFFRQDGVPNYNGLKVTFDLMQSGNDLSITRERNNGRWRTLPDVGRSRPPVFPKRAIEFISLARILPPSELHYFTKHFKSQTGGQTLSLDGRMLNAMNSVFGRTYDDINVRTVNGVSLASCQSNGSNYSGFDMGAGENAVIKLLARLQALPVGGLMIIEEIEHGLHSEAQSRLIKALTQIISQTNSRQQILFTTHSADIIDSLPREGRVLLKKTAAEHKAISRPTTRFATFSMSGVIQPEAHVFVEDNIASAIVVRCLPRDVRMRVRVLPIGDKSRVAQQLGAHMRANEIGPAMCVFDGDCEDREIRKWMRTEQLPDDGSNYCKLPGGGVSPEQWLVGQAQTQPYRARLADRLGIDEDELGSLLERLIALPDGHDVPYEFSRAIGLVVTEATSELISAVCSSHPELEEISRRVSGLIEAEIE